MLKNSVLQCGKSFDLLDFALKQFRRNYSGPSLGGYAAVIHRYEDEQEMKTRPVQGHAADTTNNGMELKATFFGLQQIRRDETGAITVYTDSKYVIDGMTMWLRGWQAQNWRKSNGKPVMNQALWEALAATSEGLNVRWEWVKGHDGDPRNQEVDAMARVEAEWAWKTSQAA